MIEPIVVTVGIGLTILLLGAQFLDFRSSSADAKLLKDEDVFDATTRRRIRESLWALPATAGAAVIVAFALDGAGRLIWDLGRITEGVTVLVVCLVLAVGIGLAATMAIAADEKPTYARLRRDLRDSLARGVTNDEIDEFERSVTVVDERLLKQSRVGLLLRIAAAVVASVVILAFVIARFQEQAFVEGGLLIVLLLLEGALFIASLAAASDLRRRRTEVYTDQKKELEAMIERARIPRRGPIPGLRDRVSRALAILRETQR